MTAKPKFKVVLMEDLLDEKTIAISNTLDKRRAILERVYSMGKVIDKGEIKSSYYFVIEE